MSIDEVTEPSVFVNECVEPTEVARSSGEVVFVRTTSGSDSELTIDLTVTGPVQDPPVQAVFPAGFETTSIVLNPQRDGLDQPVEVTVVDGDGYDTGEPASAFFFVAVATTDCAPSPTSSTTLTTVTTTEAGPTTVETLPETGVGPVIVWLSVVSVGAVGAGSLALSRARRLRSNP